MEVFYPIVNGAVSQIMLLGERLVRRGAQATVITRQTASEIPSCETINGIDVLRVKPAVGVKRIGKYLMMVPGLFALLKERKRYDLIVVCDLKILGIVGVIAAKILKKKCVLRSELCGEIDGSFATQFGPPPSCLKLLIIKILTRLRNSLLIRAQTFLSISSAITTEYLKAGIPLNAITEISNGIDVRHFAPIDQEEKALLRQNLGLSDDKHFLYTGRLAEGKGLKCLLGAWEKLTREKDKIHLLLIGSGGGYSNSCEDALKVFVREHNLESTVTFTGNVNNVDEYLQSGDFFVLPSQTESFSLSLIEAMACELPSIATPVGGILDIIEDSVNGILVPYGDEDKLFRAMKKILENGKKAVQIGTKGRQTVHEKFNIDEITQQYLLLFKRLLKAEE